MLRTSTRGEADPFRAPRSVRGTTRFRRLLFGPAASVDSTGCLWPVHGGQSAEPTGHKNRSVGGSRTIFTGTRPGLTPSPGRWHAGGSSYSFPSLPLSPLGPWPRPAKWGINLPVPLVN